MNQADLESGSWIKELISDLIAASAKNSMQEETPEPAWEEALVGFASGADKIWQQYKEYVGPFHWTPWEIYNQYHPGKPAIPQELTVISWVLPQRRRVRKANRSCRRYPAAEWARTRVYGEEFNSLLRSSLVQSLQEAGYPAVAPMLAPNWTYLKSQRFSYASTWSERHAAHACGLGTFGLCDGLITSKGKAMRAGSVVAKVCIQPTPRPYNHHQAYCLFFAQGTCGKCIDRCPVRAITEAGHNKEKCQQHVASTREYVKRTYGFEGYGCGLCQVGVPCEAGIPVKAARDMLQRGEVPPPPPPLA